MNSLALLFPLLWFFTSAPLLTDEALRVVAEDPALGEEIARAARRYVRGPIQVAVDRSPVMTAEGSGAALSQSSEARGEGAAVLRVQRTRGTAAAERWELLLSTGRSRVVRRTLTLHEAATRFDLAEAVAIGLPDMLARLSEPAASPAPSKPPVPAVSLPPARPGLALVGAGGSPGVPRRPVSRVPSSPGMPLGALPERDLSRRLPPESSTPSAEPPTAPTSSAVASPPPLAASEAKPSAPPEATGPAPVPAPTPPAERPATTEQPVVTAPAAARPQPPAPVLSPPPSRTPAGAIVLTISGAVGLFAGIATGSAALLAARQVDSPIGGRFDVELDRRGRALDTAAIVLDSVGGAVLLAGGTWLIYHTVKTRRATPKIVPLPGGAGVSWTGAF